MAHHPTDDDRSITLEEDVGATGANHEQHGLINTLDDYSTDNRRWCTVGVPLWLLFVTLLCTILLTRVLFTPTADSLVRIDSKATAAAPRPPCNISLSLMDEMPPYLQSLVPASSNNDTTTSKVHWPVCQLRIYFGRGMFEFKWVLDTLLHGLNPIASRLQPACQVITMHLEDPAAFDGDLTAAANASASTNATNPLPPVAFLGIGSRDTQYASVSEHPEFARRRVGILMMSDEQCGGHMDGTAPYVAFFFRNYYCPQTSQTPIDYQYLMSDELVQSLSTPNSPDGLRLNWTALLQYSIHLKEVESLKGAEAVRAELSTLSPNSTMLPPYLSFHDGDALAVRTRKYRVNGTSGPRQLWMPLGYGENFMPSISKLTFLSTSQRPLVFSWEGSLKGFERPQMIDSVHNAPPEIRAQLEPNFLNVASKFGGQRGDIRTMVDYTSRMAQSQFIPCPRGMSTEQFRLWESLLSGAIPILPTEAVWPWEGKYFGHIYPIVYLLLEVPILDDFKNAAQFMADLRQMHPQLKDLTQGILVRRFGHVMNHLIRELHQRVVRLFDD